MTERKQIGRVVMQGEVFGPLCCSVQVDTFGKECIQKSKYLYLYKESVDIPTLSMVDDLLLISTCGLNSVLINGFINSKTNQKKLQYGVEKCHRMHIGAREHLCPNFHIDSWEIGSVDCLDQGGRHFFYFVGRYLVSQNFRLKKHDFQQLPTCINNWTKSYIL